MKKQALFSLISILVLSLVPHFYPGLSNQASEASEHPGETAANGRQIVAGLEASVVYAATCSQPDVQAAIDAASEGDYVVVPAGECTWTTPVDFYKSVSILGAGIDQTIITDDTLGAQWRMAPFWIQGSTGIFVRISGFTFRDLDKPDSYGMINLRGDNNTFRIDHIKFEDINARSIMISGKSYGVIDHCQFIQPGGQGVWLGDSRGDPPGSTSWNEPMSFGTAEAVYIEDSTFVWGSGGDGAVDCTDGGRYVLRYNTVQGIMAGNHGMDSRPRSCLQMEIYNNDFTPASHSTYLAVQSRGGTAVVFNNTINGNYNVGIGVTNYRSCCYAGAACTPYPYPPHGTCDGSNPLDGNTSPTAVYQGWPCKDQIGRGAYQSSQPFYEWNNTKDGADVDVTVYNNWPGCVNPQPADHVQENRDYYNDTPRPGYTPYTYPHPLTKDLILSGAPADSAIHLDWQVRTLLSPTTTWQIDYYSQTVTIPYSVTNPVSSTRSATLTGLQNYEWYTVTLQAMTAGNTATLSDTIRVMPTDLFIHLPLVLKSY